MRLPAGPNTNEIQAQFTGAILSHGGFLCTKSKSAPQFPYIPPQTPHSVPAKQAIDAAPRHLDSP
jgi:hypothetical protein